MTTRTAALLILAISAVFAVAVVIVDSQTASLWLIAAWFVPFSALAAIAAKSRDRGDSGPR